MKGYTGRNYRKKNKLPPFVALTWDLLNSRAYKDLPPSAAKALPYFLGKVKISYRDPQRYLSEFPFSYTEAKKLGFAYGTHHRVISQLIEKGFIDPVDKGGLRSFGMSCSLFRLSQRWEEYGTQNFKPIEAWPNFLPVFKKKHLQNWKTTTQKLEMNEVQNESHISKTAVVEAI